MGTFLDSAVALAVVVLLIVGGYQVYFLPQKYPFRSHRSLQIPLDDKIPFKPRWVWIYSFFYYPFIISTIGYLSNFRQFTYVLASFILLLVLQVMISLLYPVKTPDSWREFDPKNSASERFLAFIQTFDKGGNCFPSLHVAVAVLASFHIFQNTFSHIGPMIYLVFLIPFLISLSTIYTKQHFIVDIPAGAALAFVTFSIYSMAYV